MSEDFKLCEECGSRYGHTLNCKTGLVEERDDLIRGMKALETKNAELYSKIQALNSLDKMRCDKTRQQDEELLKLNSCNSQLNDLIKSLHQRLNFMANGNWGCEKDHTDIPLEQQAQCWICRALKAEARWEYVKQFLLCTDQEADEDYISAFVFDETVYFSRRVDETVEQVIDTAIANSKKVGMDDKYI